MSKNVVTLKSGLWGHSRSSEPTRIAPTSMTSIATTGLSRTVSKINGNFSRKSQNFTTPCILRPCWRSSLWNWVPALGVKKIVMGLPWPIKKFDDIFSRLDTIHQCDRDRQTARYTGRQQRPRLRTASRGKNQLISGHFNAEIDRMAKGWEILITLSRCRSMWICDCVCVQLYLHDKTKTMIGMTCNSAQ